MNERSRSGDGGKRRLDAIDEEILSLLERNARLSYEELGRRVGLSSNACRNRVAGLVGSGVIRGFHADVDRDAEGAPVHALLELRVRPGGHGPPVERYLLDLPGVQLLEHLAGPVHYSLRVRVPDLRALDDLIQQVQACGHVESTNTRIVTRQLWPK
ncbi:Lrp/AsnC family transcriptional regulator [Streptosporangium sp. NPDC000396]|uniref:Lrp/AsnC family transcriptional regulator n=1 Tax=Streptosporangium sp. NPDC000396 TaxID=3366185 RepID=UPI0036AF2A17